MSFESKQGQIPLILNGTFFNIVESDKAGNVSATCVTCNTKIKGSFKATSNFTTHLKIKHLEKLKEYTEYKKTGIPCKKTRSLPFPVIARSSPSQLKADGLILDYVVKAMQPISCVENPPFKDLLLGFVKLAQSNLPSQTTLLPALTIPTSKTLITRMMDRYETQKAALTEKLKKVDHVSVTTDIWSCHHKSYLGVTVHWIEETKIKEASKGGAEVEREDLQRFSAVLALKRFTGRHTAEHITDVLREIFTSFKIQDKITMVTTDNGSNFVKAFEKYGCVFEYTPGNGGNDLENAIDVDDLGFPVPEEGEEAEVHPEDATATLNETAFLTSLPPHARCASHTLSLVATTDLEKELEKCIPRQDKTRTTVKQVLRSTMAKCSAYWNKCSRSVLVPESIKQEISAFPITPCKTRWNSTYDSVKQLVLNGEKLDRIFEIADVPVLKSTEKEFLRSYYDALGPVAWTLDMLQAEKNLFFGSICSAIHKCKSKLQGFVTPETDSYRSFIATSLLTGLNKRFKSVLDSDLMNAYNEIMAAVSLPFSKLWWIPEEEKERIKNAFVEEARKYGEIVPPAPGQVLPTEEEEGLFDFNIPMPDQKEEDVEVECVRYFNDPDRSLISLKKYPRVYKMFLKFNTALPSSAPAERLFSYGKMIQRPQRANLGDDVFEFLLFLKLNS